MTDPADLAVLQRRVRELEQHGAAAELRHRVAAECDVAPESLSSVTEIGMREQAQQAANSRPLSRRPSSDVDQGSYRAPVVDQREVFMDWLTRRLGQMGL